MSAIRVDGQRTVDSLQRMHGGIVQAAALILKSAMVDVESRAKATTSWKDRTGETRKAIGPGVRTGSGTGRLVAGGASRFLENGTVAHIIQARKAKTLRFYVNGHAVFRRSVRHHGTRGTHFLEDARNHAQADIAHLAEFFLERVIR